MEKCLRTGTVVCLMAVCVRHALSYTVERPSAEDPSLSAVEIQYFPETNIGLVQKTDDGTVFKEYSPYSDSEDKPDNSREDDETSLDSWSVVWYIASFGGLIAFFLVVSCSEWCCRRNRGRGCAQNASNTPPVPDTPPPSYDQFAPPPYESLCGVSSGGEKSQYDVYVVPVHALDTMMVARTDDAPPSYVTASGGSYSAVYPPTGEATPSQAEQGRVGTT